MGYGLKVRSGKWIASYTHLGETTQSESFDKQSDSVKAIEFHKSTGKWPHETSEKPKVKEVSDTPPDGPLTVEQIEAHLAGHASAGSHYHTPEALKQISGLSAVED